MPETRSGCFGAPGVRLSGSARRGRGRPRSSMPQVGWCLGAYVDGSGWRCKSRRMPPAELQPPQQEPMARLRAWGRLRADRVGEQFRARSESSPTINLSVQLYERDRDAFASMFGSAIALRLFLFLVPAMLVVVGLIATVAGTDGLDRLVDCSDRDCDMGAATHPVRQLDLCRRRRREGSAQCKGGSAWGLRKRR